jgi:hypothetical protein
MLRLGLRPTVRCCLLLLVLVCLPLRSQAEELKAGHWTAGGNVQGAFAFKGQSLLLTGIASYVFRDNMTVGLEGGHSVVGLSVWRVGAVAQFFFGSDYLRPFAQARIEALSVGKEIGPALGFAFGVSWQPSEQLSVAPLVGFDGAFQFKATSLIEAGVTVQYVVF